MPKKSQQPEQVIPSGFANRIIEYGTKPADQFTANPLNPRIHPQFQREVMQAALSTVGWIAPVIENRRTGYLVDGHERVMQALLKNEPVPYVLVDLSEDEEKQALATFDPIAGLAQYDSENINALLSEIHVDEIALQQLLANMQSQYGGREPDDPYAEWKEMPEFVSEDKSGFKDLIVHFDSEADLKAFALLLNQPITTKTKSIWYPFREREQMKGKVWVSDES